MVKKIFSDVKEILANDSLAPAVKPIAKAIGGIIHFVFQHPIEYGVVKEAELEKLASSIGNGLNKIPLENRTDENLGLIMKAFEDSKYNLSDNVLREYFAHLITHSCDNRYSIHPKYSEILKNLSQNDAILIQYLYDKKLLFRSYAKFKTPLIPSDEPRYYNYSNHRFFLFTEEFVGGILRDYENPIWETRHTNDFKEHDILSQFLILYDLGLIQKAYDEQWNPVVPPITRLISKQDFRELPSVPPGIKAMSLSEISVDEVIVEPFELNQLGINFAEIVCK